MSFILRFAGIFTNFETSADQWTTNFVFRSQGQTQKYRFGVVENCCWTVELIESTPNADDFYCVYIKELKIAKVTPAPPPPRGGFKIFLRVVTHTVLRN